jgi:hypothetical protein
MEETSPLNIKKGILLSILLVPAILQRKFEEDQLIKERNQPE